MNGFALLPNKKKTEVMMFKIYSKPQMLNFESDDVFLHFTGNIFGIGCSVFSKKAIKRIKKLKSRAENKGFIVLFASFKMLKHYLPSLQNNTKVFNLLKQYLPGNLTVILSCEDDRLSQVTVDKKLAVRIPQNHTLRAFIEQIGIPILSTSINMSNEQFCNDLNIIKKDFGDWFDYGIFNPKDEQNSPLPSTVISFEKGLNLIREGSIDFSEISESYEKPLIQFVCIGNICRSPMAEAYFNHLIKEKNLPFRTASCGLVNGNVPISKNSKIIMDAKGYDTNNKHSIEVNSDIVRKSMILLCMTKDVKNNLCVRFPDAKHKIFTFAEYTGNMEDIPDPFQMDMKQYEKAWEIIKKYCDILCD